MATNDEVERIYKLTVDAKQALAQFKKFNDQAKKSTEGISEINKILSRGFNIAVFTKAYQTVSQAVSQLTVAAGEMENMRNQLASFQNTGNGISLSFGQIYEASQKLPVSLAETQRAFVNLAGVERDATKYLDAFSAAASASTDSAGTFQAITDLVTRTVAGGLGLEDLNRLVDRGIPAFKILNDALGLSRLEITKFGTSAEGAGKVVDALMTGIRDRYGELNDLKLDSLTVKMEKVTDAATNMLANIADATGITNAMKEYMDSTRKTMNAVGDAFDEAAKRQRAYREAQVKIANDSSLKKQLSQLEELKASEKGLTDEQQRRYDMLRSNLIANQQLVNLNREYESLDKQRVQAEQLVASNRKIGGALLDKQQKILDGIKAKQDEINEAIKRQTQYMNEASAAQKGLGDDTGNALRSVDAMVAKIQELNKTKADKLREQIAGIDEQIKIAQGSTEDYSKQIKILTEQRNKLMKDLNKPNDKIIQNQANAYRSIQDSIESINATNSTRTTLENRITAQLETQKLTTQQAIDLRKQLNDALKVKAENDEAEQAKKDLKDLKEAYDSLNGSLNPAIALQKEYNADMKTLANAFKEGLITNVEDYAKIAAQLSAQFSKDMNDIKTAGKDTTDLMKNLEDSLADYMKDGVGKISDSLVDFAVTGKQSFGDMATSILTDIAKMITRMVMLNSVMQGLKSMGFSGFGDMMSGVFSAPPVAPAPPAFIPAAPPIGNAGGGVTNQALNQALTFASRQNQTTSSQPEVAPVNITINQGVDGVQANVSETQDASGMRQVVIDIVRDSVANGGLDETMQTSFGIRRQGW